MIRYVVGLMLGTVLLTRVSLAQPGNQEAPLRAVLEGIVTALNEQDVEGFVENLAEDVEITVRMGGAVSETLAGREQVRQALQFNPPWGLGGFSVKLPPNRVKWGLMGREALALADLEINAGGQILRPRFVFQLRQNPDRTWSITHITEADNSPWDEATETVGKAGVYLVVGFDLAPGVTEEDLAELLETESLQAWFRYPGVVSLRTYKNMPFPLPGYEAFPEYMTWVGLRSMADLEAMGTDPGVQDLREKTEQNTRNFHLNIFTLGQEINAGDTVPEQIETE